MGTLSQLFIVLYYVHVKQKHKYPSEWFYNYCSLSKLKNTTTLSKVWLIDF